jgi:hypothetical protein
MGPASITIITAVFALSVLSLITSLVVVVLNFALNYSGFNLSSTSASCGSAYLNKKLAVLYLPLRAHTIAAVIAVCLSSVVLILLVRIYCPLRGMENTDSITH